MHGVPKTTVKLTMLVHSLTDRFELMALYIMLKYIPCSKAMDGVLTLFNKKTIS